MSKKGRRSKRGIRTRHNYIKLVDSIKKSPVKISSAYGSGSVSFVGGDGGVGNILMQQYITTKYVTYNIYHPIYNPNGNKYGA